MTHKEQEDWMIDLEIKAESPVLLQEVEDAYEVVDRAFYVYFGKGFQPGFIHTAEAGPLPLRYRFLTSLLIAGEWIPKTRTLRLYPSTFRVAGFDTVLARKATLYHEFGHAFDDQSISDNIYETNVAGREAFAELGKIVAFSGGDTTEVTKKLSVPADKARAFLPASRINLYPSRFGTLEDAAFFHYIISDWGLPLFKEFYRLIPQTLNRRAYLAALVFSGFSSQRVDEAFRLWLDCSIYKDFFLGGYTMENLSKEAKKWYGGQTSNRGVRR